ncbi:hypothetical protein HDV00_010446 [Rhizophlyctis rosea]|nr:hypothetical protein HDV00_010446 [Rhizophlyctis rosea]
MSTSPTTSDAPLIPTPLSTSPTNSLMSAASPALPILQDSPSLPSPDQQPAVSGIAEVRKGGLFDEEGVVVPPKRPYSPMSQMILRGQLIV